MPIDPRIPLMGRPSPGPSPTEVFSQIAQIQAMRQQAAERAEDRAEKRAVRERQKQIETAMQGAITLDPATGEPTVDYAKLVPHLPAPVLLQLKSTVDEGRTHALALRTANLTFEEKQIGYRGVIARDIAAGNYDQTLFEAGVLSARRMQALTQAETDQMLSQAADPDFRKRTVDSAIRQAAALAGGKAEDGFTLSEGQVRYGPGGQVLATGPPKTPAETGFTLTPGGQRFDAAGNVVASVPAAPREPKDERLVSVIGLDGKPVYVRESAALGKTPGSAAVGPEGAKLSAGQQEDIATMLTVQDLSKAAVTLGEQIKWRGTGPVGGRLGALEAQFGAGGKDPERLRNMLSNIQGTLAKLRGGTSFTPSEQALLDRYTPTVTDSVLQIKAKLQSLDEFITAKRENTLRVAGGEYGPRGGAAAPPPPAERKPGPNPFAKK